MPIVRKLSLERDIAPVLREHGFDVWEYRSDYGGCDVAGKRQQTPTSGFFGCPKERSGVQISVNSCGHDVWLRDGPESEAMAAVLLANAKPLGKELTIFIGY